MLVPPHSVRPPRGSKMSDRRGTGPCVSDVGITCKFVDRYEMSIASALKNAVAELRYEDTRRTEHIDHWESVT